MSEFHSLLASVDTLHMMMMIMTAEMKMVTTTTTTDHNSTPHLFMSVCLSVCDLVSVDEPFVGFA